MDPSTLQGYLALFAAAMALGQDVYAAVKNATAPMLTPDELVALEQAWDEDAQRSAANAGIPAAPDTPLPVSGF